MEEHSSWCPSGFCSWSVSFLIYINDITENLGADCFLYPDDTSLYDIVDTPEMFSVKLNNDLKKISDWAHQWLVILLTLIRLHQ